jgi:hypothetical protein
MGQDHLLHGKTLSVFPTTDLDHIDLPFFNREVSSYFCSHRLLIKSTRFEFIICFIDFLTSRGWEGDI